MKILKLVFSTMVLVSLTFLAQANTTPVAGKVIVKAETEGKTLTLQLANLQQLSTKVTITSLDGDTSYHANWIEDHNGYTQSIDLENLPEGRYKLTVKNDGESYVKVVKVESDRLLLSQVAQ